MEGGEIYEASSKVSDTAEWMERRWNALVNKNDRCTDSIFSTRLETDWIDDGGLGNKEEGGTGVSFVEREGTRVRSIGKI